MDQLIEDYKALGYTNVSEVQTSSGTGYYISEGRAIPIRWSKSSRGEQTKYMLENGEELTVNDGNTFIQIQPRAFSPSIS